MPGPQLAWLRATHHSFLQTRASVTLPVPSQYPATSISGPLSNDYVPSKRQLTFRYHLTVIDEYFSRGCMPHVTLPSNHWSGVSYQVCRNITGHQKKRARRYIILGGFLRHLLRLGFCRSCLSHISLQLCNPTCRPHPQIQLQLQLPLPYYPISIPPFRFFNPPYPP
jgi:hypothetical protein